MRKILRKLLSSHDDKLIHRILIGLKARKVNKIREKLEYKEALLRGAMRKHGSV